MTGPVLQVWIEFASSYSHIAAQRVEALAASHGVRVEWRAFLLGPIFKKQGWNDSPFNLYPAKGAYMWRDIQRLCEKHEIPFRRPSVFPRSGLLAARIVTAAQSEPWVGAFIRRVYLANFAEDRDISDRSCLKALLEAAGCSTPAALFSEAASPEVKERLRTRTDEAIARGIFGAPTFISGAEVFWGQDRIEDAIAWARKS